jgi:hypothetical protein
MDEDFNFAKGRRRSNSSSVTNDIGNFKTKFDVNEPEPVFEEDLHGAQEDPEDVEKVTVTSESSDDQKSSNSN